MVTKWLQTGYKRLQKISCFIEKLISYLKAKRQPMNTVTEKLQLKPAVLTEITGNNRIQNRLQLAFDKSYFSVRRWILCNHPMLTTITSLNIISEETGKTIDDLLDN